MSGFDATLDLPLKPSLRALRAVFILHVICLVLLPLSMQPGWPMIVLVALFGVSWFALRHSAVLGFNSKAITRVIWHADGGWSRALRCANTRLSCATTVWFMRVCWYSTSCLMTALAPVV